MDFKQEMHSAEGGKVALLPAIVFRSHTLHTHTQDYVHIHGAFGLVKVNT